MRRHLENRITLFPDDSIISSHENIDLEYYFLESGTEEIEDFFGIRFYGIEIVKKKNLMDVETKSIQNIFCCEADTKCLLNKLIVNKVTPNELHYVLDNILGK